MKVCIPIEFRREGGGYYFLDLFTRFLEEAGWEVIQEIDEQYDVLFTNHWMTPLRDVLRAIRRNPKVSIVQRIDGAAQNYGRDPEADVRQRAVNRFADLTIFQSAYAKFSTRELFKVIPQDGPVIHNPVDLGIFRPDGERMDFLQTIRVACVTWSTNPLKGSAQIYEVAKAMPEVGFVLCGSYADAPALPNVHKLGLLDREQLATALRSCQALLTFSQNEACPNHVLEALACGLPVLYGDSGAMREVIGECGLPVTVETFAVGLEEINSGLKERSWQARKRAEEMFSPEVTLSKYIENIRELGAQFDPLRSLSAWSAALRGI
jgi:glycosyltransferase involved in cell wall biosynthesis